MRPRLGHTFALVALALGGCVVSTTPDTVPRTGATSKGSLGRASFQYVCDSSTLVCALDGNAASFPLTVASGARFRLRAGDPSAADTVLEPIAREQMASDPDGSLVALKPGWGGMVLRQRGGGDVVDFTMMRIAQPVKIDLFRQAQGATSTTNWQMSEVGSQLQLSQRTIVQAVLRDSLGEALAGEIPLDFRAVDPSLVEITTLARGRVEVQPKVLGVTDIVVEGGGLKATVKLQVTGTRGGL